MTPITHQSRLAEILAGLMTLAANMISVFVKNPANHDKAVAVLNTLNQVAAPIAAQLEAEAPPAPAPVQQMPEPPAPEPQLETGTPADPGHTEA